MESRAAPDVVVVVSHYDRDISWTRWLEHPVLIYTKEKPGELSVPHNKGREASAYLKFIVDHYDRLPERTVFLHEEEYSWHHKGSLIDRVRDAVAQSARFRSLNDFRLGSIREMVDDNDEETREWLRQRRLDSPEACWQQLTRWFDSYLGQYLGNHDRHGDWTDGHYGSAQMIVHRERIRQHPQELYEQLYDWILNTDLPDYRSSRFMEWTWHLLFQARDEDGSPIDEPVPPPLGAGRFEAVAARARRLVSRLFGVDGVLSLARPPLLWLRGSYRSLRRRLRSKPT